MRSIASTVLLTLLLLPAAITHAGTVKTIRVDCSKGESINAALQDNADELVVEISGLCHEQVTVARNNVTLRGVDPATDGIIGPTGDPDAVALVQVWDGVNVHLENLQVSGSEVRGVSFKNSSYTTPDRTSLLNCWVIDNALDGGHFVDHSIIIAQDTTFARNLRGLSAHRDALVQCNNCTMEDNVDWPLRAYMSSRVYVFDSTVSGEGGVYAFLDASIRGLQSDVTAASGPALWADQGGEIYWAGGTITGPLRADTGALVTVDGVWHENPAGWINVSGSAALHSTATGLEGNVTVDEFGELTLKGGSTLDGDLIAAYGGDAHCEDSGLVTGTANAEHCRNIPCTHPLADCVGVEDLDFDPATQAELDAHMSLISGHHSPTVDTTCNGAVCDGTHFTNVHWDNLVSRPPGLDDGDDDTTYAAGAGLALIGTTFSLLTSPVMLPRPNSVWAVDSTEGVKHDTSITVGADGLPVVSYYDAGTADLKVARCNDEACSGGDETISTVDFSGDVGRYSSIALGWDGLPVISYYDATNEDLKVAKCNDPACAGSGETIFVVDDGGIPPADVGSHSSITVGSDGLPVISYYDATNQDLKVAKCSDAICSRASTWTVDSLGWVGMDTSITLGADGMPLISYSDVLSRALKVAKCNDHACSYGGETISEVDSGGRYTSITLGVDGLPVISHSREHTTPPQIRVSKCFSVLCDVTMNSVVGREFARTSITLGMNGLPVVSYNGGHNLVVASCQDPACERISGSWVVDASEGVSSPSITMGMNGLPVVSYGAEGGLWVAKCGSAFCVPYLRRR